MVLNSLAHISLNFGEYLSLISQFDIQLNDIIMETFSSITKVEEGALKSTGKTDLTINELHILEEIGNFPQKGATISELSKKLTITLPSVTVAVNKLVKKGYVDKTRCKEDGRVVFVSLTSLGIRMNKAHSYFHLQMLRSLSKVISEEEKAVLIKGFREINKFFKQKALDMGIK